MKTAVVAALTGDVVSMWSVSPSMDRETVETEIREGMIQDTHVELDVVVDGIPTTVFLNAKHVISIAVGEVPDV